jgi:hypothetical protein
VLLMLSPLLSTANFTESTSPLVRVVAWCAQYERKALWLVKAALGGRLAGARRAAARKWRAAHAALGPGLSAHVSACLASACSRVSYSRTLVFQSRSDG